MKLHLTLVYVNWANSGAGYIMAIVRIDEDLKFDYRDVLIRPKRSTLKSRSDVDLVREFDFKNCGRTLKAVPIIAANMDGVGTMAMARSLAKHKMLVTLHKHYTIAELKKFFEKLPAKEAQYVFYTMGIVEADIKKLNDLLKVLDEKKIHNICIDVANGYTERFIDFSKQIRKRFPHKILMAGNVVTGEVTEELALAGVDIVKVGIGPGSVCLTRKMTGVGYPQLSAVIECADAAHGISSYSRICADGGCEVPGDVAKAFGGGADFVMVGSMLSGHIESEIEPFEKNGKKMLSYYGSSSVEAMIKHNGGVPRYRASEGKSVIVEFRGPVEKTLQEILGGLRSACTYVGARRLKELSKRTTFIRVMHQLNQKYSDD